MRTWIDASWRIAALFGTILVGCSRAPTIEAPPIEQFPQRGYQLQVQGTPEVVRRALSQRLDKMGVPYHYEHRGDMRYLISTYMAEADAPGFLKDGRSSVLIIIRPDLVYPGCTELDLRWMYELKGLFGSEWALKGNGSKHVPTLVKALHRYGERKSCRGMLDSGV